MQLNIELLFLWHLLMLVSFLKKRINYLVFGLNFFFCIVAVAIALGSLTIWHYRLIRNGETSIEAHINASETKRLAAMGKCYSNPYNFGTRKNLRLFLGLVRRR